MEQQYNLDVSCFRLSEVIRPYFTTLHSFVVDCPGGGFVRDLVHPEWAAMRFADGTARARAGIIPEELAEQGKIAVSGPTCRAIRFEIPTMRFISLGLQPAGWARFVPVSASSLSNQLVDGAHRPFALFAPLLEEMRAAGDDHEEAAARFNSFLLHLHECTPPATVQVLACQEALRDPELGGVGELSDRVGMGRRTLERMCSRYFGFPPKILLRRQRFLRSLGRFMRESRDSWSTALDRQYFDQAHFVREFRSFMGITPSEYADMPHPILDRIIAQRIVDQGAGLRTDLPTMLHYAGQRDYSSEGESA